VPQPLDRPAGPCFGFPEAGVLVFLVRMLLQIQKRIRPLLAGLLVLALAAAAAWWSAPELLRVDTGAPASVDAVVVLGGESWTRPDRAAEVFRATQPPLMIVSGDGDCEDVRRLLEARAVPAERIVTECTSRSTFENAQNSVRLLRAQHVRKAIIVTSWFHSRRALACFRAAAPEIQFYSQPTKIAAGRPWWADRRGATRILLEYLKLPYYWVMH
jgi:uncharacterized SAM-binding protein YcdF (DUF218 family)